MHALACLVKTAKEKSVCSKNIGRFSLQLSQEKHRHAEKTLQCSNEREHRAKNCQCEKPRAIYYHRGCANDFRSIVAKEISCPRS